VTDPGCRLYLITPPAFEPAAFSDQLSAALDAGDVASLQLRLKDTDDDAIKRAAELLMPVCHARNVAFIVNDRPDLAAAVGADGVHIGIDDGSYAEARAAVGDDAVVGVSCYDSVQVAMDVADDGADYVAFGAFFDTTSKNPRARAPLDLLEFWSRFTVVPCVAIGGITVGNCGSLVRAGADFLAVIAGVWGYPEGPAAAVRAFDAAIHAARGDTD